jgi:hypothetical protein
MTPGGVIVPRAARRHDEPIVPADGEVEDERKK